MELFQEANALDQFEASFNNLRYLGQLSEQMLWDQYNAGISVAGKAKFKDFSQDNIQAFYRLKLQSIEIKLGGLQPDGVLV